MAILTKTVREWLEDVHNKRLSTASSAENFKFHKSRIRHLSGPGTFPEKDDALGQGGVLYWMSRDQRVQDNWAFIYAQRLAIKFKVPLQVCFCLVPAYQADTLRQFAFMIGGLTEVEQETWYQKINTRWQGCLLSPFLFLLVIDWIMKTSASKGKHGIQWTSRMQLDDLDFADDLALLSQTQQQMQEKTTSVASASAAVDLNIHKGKSKILRYNTACTNPIKIDETIWKM
ncbi:unnamed protein product [Schistosoma curassoni]|uniref:Photolyase/cryptochrome alpha/beta domain-containing protein n=1 Tax=Schistosoma curassoni TaxID=6186 RepID=A0A183KY54_9TREM|nr:unnamed protein product [Schistosoma curassoni]